MDRWHRTEQLPIRLHGTIAVERYSIIAMDATGALRIYGAATRDEAEAIAARQREEPQMVIVTIAHTLDVWERQEPPQ